MTPTPESKGQRPAAIGGGCVIPALAGIQRLASVLPRCAAENAGFLAAALLLVLVKAGTMLALLSAVG